MCLFQDYLSDRFLILVNTVQERKMQEGEGRRPVSSPSFVFFSPFPLFAHSNRPGLEQVDKRLVYQARIVNLDIFFYGKSQMRC